MTITWTSHKYFTRHKKCLKQIYNDIVAVLITDHAQPTSIEMTDDQYLHMMANYILYDKN